MASVMKALVKKHAEEGLWPVVKNFEQVGAARHLCGLIRELKNLVPEASKRRDYA